MLEEGKVNVRLGLKINAHLYSTTYRHILYSHEKSSTILHTLNLPDHSFRHARTKADYDYYSLLCLLGQRFQFFSQVMPRAQCPNGWIQAFCW